MLKKLEELRKEAKEERARVVAPYDKRIKELNKAINAVVMVNRLSEVINTSSVAPVSTIPELEESKVEE